MSRPPVPRPEGRKPDLSRVRVCDQRCDTCIFGPRSPISWDRRREYAEEWKRKDSFQNCHFGTLTEDRALICKGFYDWCKRVGWEPTIIQLGERLNCLDFVPVPSLKEG